MAIRRLTSLFRRARHILYMEGVLALLGHRKTYHIVEINPEAALREINVADFVPKLKNFTFRIVSTVQQADEVAAEGFEFPYYDKDVLDEGGIAFCVYVGRELAHVTWLAVTEEAKGRFNPLPYRVDFANGEVCLAWTWTKPKYRGNSIMGYVGVKWRQFLKDRGTVTLRLSRATDNVAAERGATKAGEKKYAELRYVRVLWWRSWQEKPLK